MRGFGESSTVFVHWDLNAEGAENRRGIIHCFFGGMVQCGGSGHGLEALATF